MFTFKRFTVDDSGCAMKVGTDSVLLGAWVDITNTRTALDLGAGSGVLSLMMAQRAPQARIWGVEIDAAAAACAAANYAASPWAERLSVEVGDASRYSPESAPDLIICNPPYFTGGLRAPDSRRCTARHSDAGSFGAVDALRLAGRWLSEEGSIAMVTPYADLDDLIFEAEMQRLEQWRSCKVYTNAEKPPTRMLWQFARKGTRGFCEEHEIAVRAGGVLTDAYRRLTRDFYLHS